MGAELHKKEGDKKIKLFMTDKLKKFMHLNCVRERERKQEWREIYIEKVFAKASR